MRCSHASNYAGKFRFGPGQNIGASEIPDQLEVITFVERDEGRAQRLSKALKQIVPWDTPFPKGGDVLKAAKPEARERLRAVGYASGSKAHVFAAMPFAERFEDIYYYGIRNAVKKAGLLCERADLSSFTGDVMAWVRDRIKTASLVIADLTGANPNVYLEVGFAWGTGVPTLLLVQDSSELRFDVQGQRCLIYKNIRDLEEKLGAELSRLDTTGIA